MTQETNSPKRPLRFEMLYPEVANLFGDTQNLRYLTLCLPEAELIRTSLNDEPLFGREIPDLIYLGPMSEESQRVVVKRLIRWRERIAELIANGTVFLFTGNALEVLGQSITNPEQGYELEGLGILELHSEIELFNRFNGKVLGEFVLAGDVTGGRHAKGDGSILGGRTPGNSYPGTWRAPARGRG
ncbi:MAG: hypothetical protein LBI64_05365, partial [Coriobacteriales bacterium]|nr:hypothetical protein [Coriobacteriales bacterium]